MDKTSIPAKLVTYKTAGYALLVVVFGGLLLWWSNIDWPQENRVWQTTVNQLGGLLIATGGLAILWDLRGKRDFMDEVLEKARLASDVSAAGLDRVSMDWMSVPWDELFSNASHIQVFISYGSSWRKLHWQKLKNFAQNEKHSLRLYLPDPEDEPTMKVLALRYDYTIEKVQANVRETAEEMVKLGAESKADIRVYFRAGDPTYTSYMFDEKALVTLYSHKRQRGDVPTFLVNKGTFGDFFKADLEAIHHQSREVALADFEEKK